MPRGHMLAMVRPPAGLTKERSHAGQRPRDLAAAHFSRRVAGGGTTAWPG
jgi:hypothetical protein